MQDCDMKMVITDPESVDSLEYAPKAFVEQLENAVLFSKEKTPINDTIMLDITPGELTTVGRGSTLAVVDSRELEECHPWGISLVLDLEEVEALCKAVRAMEGFSRKDTRLDLKVSEDGIQALSGGVELGSASVSELSEEVHASGVYEEALRFSFEPHDAEAPVLMRIQRGLILKATKLKLGSPAKDEDQMNWMTVRHGPQGSGTVAVRQGPTVAFFAASQVA